MIFERIKKLCDERGISIAKLEQETGLGNATIRGWRESSPSVENLKRVADYLGVTIDALISENEEFNEDSNEESFPEIEGECSGMQVFCNEEFGHVRSMLIDGAPWFVLKDVCAALGLVKADRVSARLDEDEKGTHLVSTPGGKQRMTVINESGLYSVILRSDKPQAKPFRKWVTSEVLPAIRKTGQYAVPEIAAPATPTITVDDCLAAARLLASCRADRLPLVVSLLDQAGFDIDQTRLPQRFTRPRQIEENYDYFQYADISLYLRDDEDDD